MHGWRGDATLVRLIDDSSATEIWRGTLQEFKADNVVLLDTLKDIEADLFIFGYSFIGGGAEQAFTLEIVS